MVVMMIVMRQVFSPFFCLSFELCNSPVQGFVQESPTFEQFFSVFESSSAKFFLNLRTAINIWQNRENREKLLRKILFYDNDSGLSQFL